MKVRYVFLSLLAVMSVLGWQSCTQTDETGSVKFGMSFNEESTLKSTDPDGDEPGVAYRLTEALVTIANENGEVIYEKEPIPLYHFGGSYMTKALELPAGDYQLLEFMLIDETGTVLWATPKEGSPLAHLVDDPLPVHFSVHPNTSTSLQIQVVRVANHPPEDFGYISFAIEFVNRFCLKVDYVSRCSELDFAPWYRPRILIMVNYEYLLDGPLEEGLNRFALPIRHTDYTIMATNCMNDTIFYRTFSLDELLMHRCSPEFEPLKIYDGPGGPDIIITPEGLKEPTIEQGLFGRMVTPVYMDSVVSISADCCPPVPVVADLYLFYSHTLENVQAVVCPADAGPDWMPPYQPAAIVRSNSDGYFQVKLDVGMYYYFVRTNWRCYTDLTVECIRPNHVMIYPLEVTRLSIIVKGCWEITVDG